MNFDLSISPYLDGHYMLRSTALSAAIVTTALVDPFGQAGIENSWNVRNANALLSQLPNAAAERGRIPGNGTLEDLAPLFTIGGVIAAQAIFGDRSRETTHARMREVLDALGVTNITWPGHHNHFHIDLRVPSIMKIARPNALNASSMGQSAGVSDSRLVADDPKSSEVVGKFSSRRPILLGACRFVEVSSSPGSAINSVAPLGAVDDYEKKSNLKSSLNVDTAVQLIKKPKLGHIRDFAAEPYEDTQGNVLRRGFQYYGPPGINTSVPEEQMLLGKDSAEFRVDGKDRSYILRYSFFIVRQLETMERMNPEIFNRCNYLRGQDVWKIGGEADTEIGAPVAELGVRNSRNSGSQANEFG